MLINDKCIFVYGANSEEIAKLSNLNIRIVEITQEMTQMTLEEILQGFRFKTFNPNPVKERIVILNSFSDNEIKLHVKLIRETVKDVILALPTEGNIKWKFDELAKHLVEEKQWHLRNQKGR